MAKDWLRYDQMVEDTLRGVVRRALLEAATSGLPGDHHFYITFRTDGRSVRIPPHLKAQWPREMTIVLQHQFWGLEVNDDSFSVRLSFGGKQEQLFIPFNTIVSFTDPSVKFALQFESAEGDAADDHAEASEPPIALAKPDAKPVITDGRVTSEPTVERASSAVTREGSATVVALDAFRKKL